MPQLLSINYELMERMTVIRFLRKISVEAMKKSFAARNHKGHGLCLRRPSGQVGLILILLAALGLVFYAMTMNLTKVSKSKNSTMIAAESSASFMASFMASYAQMMSEEQLKGRLKYCKSTSLLARLITFIALLVIIIVAPYLMEIGAGIMKSLIIATILSGASAVVDAVVLQPSITNMWSDAMAKSLTIEGQLVEYGVQVGLTTVVDDNAPFPDLLDSDMDGAYGWEDPAAFKANDTISRFTYYYTERLKLASVPDMGPLTEFVKQLGDFIFFFDDEGEQLDVGDPEDTSDDIWGIHDSVGDNAVGHVCTDGDPLTTPAECNPGCVGARAVCCDIPGCSDTSVCTGGVDDPECCLSCSDPPSGSPDISCELEGVPEGASCNGNSYMGSDYLYVYDPFYEDTTNAILSLREMIGRDDESAYSQVDPAAANWHVDASMQQVLRPGVNALNGTTQEPKDWYHIEDTSGFYVGDTQTGVYPLFYTMRDLKTDLSYHATLPAANQYQGYECYWKGSACFDYFGVDSMGVYESADKDSTMLYALKGEDALADPDDFTTLGPINALSGLTGEVRDLGAGGTPDQVPELTSFFGNESTCGGYTTSYQWQRGIDRFCSKNYSQCTTDPAWFCYDYYPYHMGCGKHGVAPNTGNMTCVDTATGDGGDITNEPRDCYCGEAGAWDPMFFPMDALDEVYYGLQDFLGWTSDFIEKFAVQDYRAAMRKGIVGWYDEAAEWIEPACDDPSCDVGDMSCCPGSYTKEDRTGMLYIWMDALKWIYTQLTNWIYPDTTDYPDAYQGGSACLGTNAVWCVPYEQTGVSNEYGIEECPGVSPAEQATFNVNEADPDNPGSGMRGDLEDVVACLEWNVFDEHVFIDELGAGQIAVGNRQKFQQCADHCGPWACSSLPRYLVALSGKYSWIDLSDLENYWSDKQKYMYCLNSGSYEACDSRCLPDSSGGPLPMINSVTSVPYSIDLADFNPPDTGSIAAIETERMAWIEDCADGFLDSGPILILCNPAFLPDYSITSCDTLVEDPEIDACMDSWGGSCEAVLNGGIAAQTGDVQFYGDAVNVRDTEADDTTGFCFDDSDTNGTADFIEWAQQNADASENFVKKLHQRWNFLNYVLQEAQRVRAIFGEAADRFAEFLNNHTPYDQAPPVGDDAVLDMAGYIDPDRDRDVEWWDDTQTAERQMDDGTNVYEHYDVDSPAELLVAMRADEEDKDLSSVAVYVWRGEDLPPERLRPPSHPNPSQGYLHAVKVEVRAPKRCNSACNPSADAYQPWPTIKTKTYRMGTKRCYYLINYSGLVKARVIRYDEPVDNSSRVFRFANNVPIWGMSTAHPDAGPGDTVGIFGDGGSMTVCDAQVDPYIREVGETLNTSGIPDVPMYLHHAFMLNEPPETAPPALDPGNPDQFDYDTCWNQVHEQLLRVGVHSESCAKYLWEGRDFGVRFVPCDQGFLGGMN